MGTGSSEQFLFSSVAKQRAIEIGDRPDFTWDLRKSALRYRNPFSPFTRLLTIATLSIVILGHTTAFAGTTVDMWGSDTNEQGIQRDCAFELRNFKRGLFLGICPTTKQLQWSYHFELSGEGPQYDVRTVSVDDSLAFDQQLTKVYLKVVSGHVLVDRKAQSVEIDIQIEQAGVTNQFVGNGAYSFHQ
jgi:hypothetical protein